MFWKVFRLAPVSVAVYLLCVPVSWLATLLAWIFSPLIAGISIATGKNTVGGPLSWLYTHNATLDGGVDQKVPGYVTGPTGFKLWWQRVCWICRNPGGKVDALLLGFKADGSKVVFENGPHDTTTNQWYVIQSTRGWRYFGYRGNGRWFGWTYSPRGGYHMIKAKPFSF